MSICKENSTKENLIMVFLIILLLPDFLYYTASLNNFSISTLISIIFLLFIVYKEKVTYNNLVLITVVFAIVSINVLLSAFFFDASVLSLKIVLSIITFVIMLLSAGLVSKKIDSSLGLSLQSCLERIYYFLLFIGVVSAFLFQFKIITNKNMIIFSEPSAYALIFTPVFTFFISFKRGYVSMFYIIFSLAIAFLIQNLTMILGVILAVMATKNLKARYALLFILCFIALSLSDVIQDKLVYFLERVDFTNTTNLSVLVYLSGIERAYLNFMHSYGLGIGFQQMGLNGVLGVNQNLLKGLDAGNLNLFDGSFIASKLISETGIVGLFFIACYLVSSIKKIHRFKTNHIQDVHHVLYYSFYISFFLPLFVRGAGYMNPYVFMYLVSVFGFLHMKNRLS